MAKNKTTYGPRWSRFCGWCLRKLGWTSDSGPAPENKAIMLGVPHTSFWDFIISYLFYTQYGRVAHVMIKKELFFWPLGPILRACGCIPVDRSSSTAMVKSLISEMEDCEIFHLAIAPEGTRKPVKRWKTGALLIARETGAAIHISYFDWGNKRIGIGERFEPSGDFKADMQRIQEIYEGMHLTGKNAGCYITH